MLRVRIRGILVSIDGDTLTSSLTTAAVSESLPLLLPTAWSLVFGLMSLRPNSGARILHWLEWRRRMKILLVIFIPGWVTWSAAHGVGSQKSPLPISLLIPFTAAVLIAQLVTYCLDTTFVGRRWTAQDLCRLSLWSTLSFAVPLLAITIGLDAIFNRHFYGVFWIAGAGVLSMIAAVKLRSAEGIKPRQVKSGDLYKRAVVLSKKMGVRLDKVSVVPFGRGRLTNAFGGWRGITVTDDYGHWLRGAQLDFVVGHELGHLDQKHGLKKLLVIVSTVSSLIIFDIFSPSASQVWRIAMWWVTVFVPLLTFYFMSRRFEYEADRSAADLVDQGEIGIAALLSLYRRTGAPTSSSFLEELFSTHPSLQKRIRKIALVSGVSDERVKQAEQEILALVEQPS